MVLRISNHRLFEFLLPDVDALESVAVRSSTRRVFRLIGRVFRPVIIVAVGGFDAVAVDDLLELAVDFVGDVMGVLEIRIFTLRPSTRTSRRSCAGITRK